MYQPCVQGLDLDLGPKLQGVSLNTLGVLKAQGAQELQGHSQDSPARRAGIGKMGWIIASIRIFRAT